MKEYIKLTNIIEQCVDTLKLFYLNVAKFLLSST